MYVGSVMQKLSRVVISRERVNFIGVSHAAILRTEVI